MDIFLNRLIEFYSNNATNLHHQLTTCSTTGVAPQNGDRIATTNTWRHFTLCITFEAKGTFTSPRPTASQLSSVAAVWTGLDERQLRCDIVTCYAIPSREHLPATNKFTLQRLLRRQPTRRRHFVTIHATFLDKRTAYMQLFFIFIADGADVRDCVRQKFARAARNSLSTVNGVYMACSWLL